MVNHTDRERKKRSPQIKIQPSTLPAKPCSTDLRHCYTYASPLPTACYRLLAGSVDSKNKRSSRRNFSNTETDRTLEKKKRYWESKRKEGTTQTADSPSLSCIL
mmetsp:Transcript_40241/g.79328  ORF Transcript_40241/g.79328 Transcript_40241/m.79328 type:complete len:104 (+) Transcript_40241:531-842(+)